MTDRRIQNTSIVTPNDLTCQPEYCNSGVKKKALRLMTYLTLQVEQSTQRL